MRRVGGGPPAAGSRSETRPHLIRDHRLLAVGAALGRRIPAEEEEWGERSVAVCVWGALSEMRRILLGQQFEGRRRQPRA